MRTMIIALAMTSLLLMSCGGTEESKANSSAPLTNEDVSTEVAQLKELNSALLTATAANTYVAGKALYDAANQFAVKYPHHEKTAPILELSAKGAEAMGQYQEAVNILDKLINEFPETAETPNYMMNKARIVEDRMGVTKAKEAYNDLITRFPDNPMSIDAKLYVENFLDKSPADVQKMLDSINAEH